MPQISKHIPIEGHANFPSTLSLHEYAILEGRAYVTPAGQTIAANGYVRTYLRTTGTTPYMFGLHARVATLQPTAYIKFLLYEMTIPTSPSAWTDYFHNMNRLHPNNDELEVGGYLAEGSTKVLLYSNYLTIGTPFSLMWLNADLTQYYGLQFYNEDASYAAKIGLQIYTIAGKL